MKEEPVRRVVLRIGKLKTEEVDLRSELELNGRLQEEERRRKSGSGEVFGRWRCG